MDHFPLLWARSSAFSAFYSAPILTESPWTHGILWNAFEGGLFHSDTFSGPFPPSRLEPTGAGRA
jgi:hypothetical protein